MSKRYNKLVRDKIPDIIRLNGGNPITRQLEEKEYLIELIEKLKEETEEFAEEYLIEEMADIEEVLIAIRESLGITSAALEDVRRKKAEKNGRFKDRIYLEGVE